MQNIKKLIEQEILALLNDEIETEIGFYHGRTVAECAREVLLQYSVKKEKSIE